MVELFAGIGIGGVHPGCDVVGDNRPLFAVLGPRGDRVGQVLPDHAFETWDFARLIEPTEQVIERAVLEYHEDDMVKGVRSTDRHDTSLIGPQAPPARGLRLPGHVSGLALERLLTGRRYEHRVTPEVWYRLTM